MLTPMVDHRGVSIYIYICTLCYIPALDKWLCCFQKLPLRASVSRVPQAVCEPRVDIVCIVKEHN